MCKIEVNIIDNTPKIGVKVSDETPVVDVKILAPTSGGGEVNKIDAITVNGVVVEPVNKTVALTIPTETGELDNTSGFITNLVNDLVNYYQKSITYTKLEVNDLVATISTMTMEIVAVLPTENISTTTIYFVLISAPSEDNVYEEWVYINNEWESIGTTAVDLSGYVLKSSIVDNLVSVETTLPLSANQGRVLRLIIENSDFQTGEQVNATVATAIAGVVSKRDYVPNIQYDTGNTYKGKTMYGMLVMRGNADSPGIVADIPASGDLVTNVDVFLGMDWGIVKRGGNVSGANTQAHNINAISNLPDQHASVIYWQANKIQYWYNPGMTLSNFKNRPFLALIFYTLHE